MSEEKRPTPEKVTITITLPTKEKIIQTLTSLFPGIEVTVKEEEAEGEEEGEGQGEA